MKEITIAIFCHLLPAFFYKTNKLIGARQCLWNEAVDRSDLPTDKGDGSEEERKDSLPRVIPGVGGVEQWRLLVSLNQQRNVTQWLF